LCYVTLRSRVAVESRGLLLGPRRLARGRALCREAKFRLAHLAGPTIEVEWPSGRYVLSTRDMVVSRRTYVSGPFELLHLLEVVAQVERLTGRPIAGSDVLEIGANLGTTTVPLLTQVGAARVICVEPVPENCDLLTRTLALNGLLDRVDVHRTALSDCDGWISFESLPGNSGGGRIGVGTPDSRRVPVTTADLLISAGAIRPDALGLVWMDVEGHEARVLAGASTLLASRVPIVAEYWPAALPADELERFHSLVALNFSHVVPAGFDELIPAREVRRLVGRFPHHIDLVLLTL
jgi:FkbM family methyltransferase